MANALAPRSSALAVPTRNELEALGPGDRWTLEERADEIKDLCRELNDDELRRWVEVEGKTYREIAQMVGRSKSRVGERCAGLGLTPQDNRGGSRVLSGTGQNDGDEEVIDAEVVEDDPQPRPPSQSSPAAAPSSELEGAPDPGPRVKCPTCGHMVVPSDIQTWEE